MCAMVSQAGTGGIPKGWNRVDNHSWLIPAYEERIAWWRRRSGRT